MKPRSWRPTLNRVPKPLAKTHAAFRTFSQLTAKGIGSPWAFIASIALVIGWACAGPFSHYSDTWQLTINTTSSIVTFLMVFLIQNTQNRDAKAIHLKLDELIRSIDGARNKLVDLESLTDEEIEQLELEFRRLREIETARPRKKRQVIEQVR
jgi:low affinity Fe/Cu permease